MFETLKGGLLRGWSRLRHTGLYEVQRGHEHKQNDRGFTPPLLAFREPDDHDDPKCDIKSQEEQGLPAVILEQGLQQGGVELGVVQ